MLILNLMRETWSKQVGTEAPELWESCGMLRKHLLEHSTNRFTGWTFSVQFPNRFMFLIIILWWPVTKSCYSSLTSTATSVYLREDRLLFISCISQQFIDFEFRVGNDCDWIQTFIDYFKARMPNVSAPPVELHHLACLILSYIVHHQQLA